MACGTSQIKVRDVSMAAKVEAVLPGNDKKKRGLQAGAIVWQDMAIARFLGNTAAVGRYEGVLNHIIRNNGVARAEIESYYRQGIGALIAAAVDAEFNKTSGFMLDRKYNVILTRDAKTGQYTLSYERPSVENDDKKISAPTLEALSSAMSRSGDFSATAFNVVREQAALIPAVIFDGWKRTTPNMVNPYELLTRALTNFYITPNNENYRVICGIYARAQLAALTDGDEFTSNMLASIGQTLVSFNQEFHDKVAGDIRTNNQMIAAVEIPNDPRYGIFTLNRESGDAIFVSKTKTAPGLLVR
jgi:hypothetical protein